MSNNRLYCLLHFIPMASFPCLPGTRRSQRPHTVRSLPRVDKIIKHDRIFPHGLACQIPQQKPCCTRELLAKLLPRVVISSISIKLLCADRLNVANMTTPSKRFYCSWRVRYILTRQRRFSFTRGLHP
jgi:hypothetical protein